MHSSRECAHTYILITLVEFNVNAKDTNRLQGVITPCWWHIQVIYVDH